MKTVKKTGKVSGLKDVPASKKGLAKLPTVVRNKMGYKKNGGSVMTKAQYGKEKKPDVNKADVNKADANTEQQKIELDKKYNELYKTKQNDSIVYSNKNIGKTYADLRIKDNESPSAKRLANVQAIKNKIEVAKLGTKTPLDARGRANAAMSNFKKGGAVKKAVVKKAKMGGSVKGKKC